MTTMRHDRIDPGAFATIEDSTVAETSPRVADRMTRPVVTIGWQAPVSRAARIMRERQIRHLPVVDSTGRLLGIVTDGDLRETLAADGVRDASAAPPTLIVAKAMTWTPVAVSPCCALADAVALMHARKLSALPVVDDHHVVGILTEHDVLRAFTETIARR